MDKFSEDEKKELEKDASEFRKEKIKEFPLGDDYREKLIERERGTDENQEEMLKLLRKTYYDLIEIIKKYMDMKEEHIKLVAIWIIGTYLHDDFYTYPYLFFNAMKGSGKSRLLELIAVLSKDGRFTKSPTEAVLFRTKGTLAIDEFERVGKKEQAGVRELLNSAYKKGIKVSRMKKVKKLGGEEYQVEDFDVYRPVTMANIWGMEEVLGDRCITLILEKSSDDTKTRLVQDYDINDTIKNACFTLNQCRLCLVSFKKNIYIYWNNYVIYKGTTTPYDTNNTNNTNNNNNNIILHLKLDNMFLNIYNSGLKGRTLELFLPLFFISGIIDQETFQEILKTAVDISKDKDNEEEVENRDYSLIKFVSMQTPTMEYTPIKILYNNFLDFMDETEQNISIWWFGKALRRLNLLINKRRLGRGREVILDVGKAKGKVRKND